VTALYFVWVTASTVGYGDYSPQTQLGRVLSVVLVPFVVRERERSPPLP
jgi:hypothetical protein